MANSIDIVVPDLGDFENVEIIEVLVAPGDSVAREDGLITLETDKASFDVPAPESGVIEKLTVGNGDTVSTGDVIGRMTVEISDTVVITPALAAEPTGETTMMAAPAGEPRKSGGKQTLVVPDLGDFDDVEVIEVHIAPGDTVAVEDPLVTLETDKAAMDVPAVVAGTIESVLIKVGEKISAGASLAIIDAVADQKPDTAPAAAQAAAKPQASA
ncbi:MAG: biotin/lipoyl-containing protein, partial [Woeseiaceae bacterium]